MAVAGVIPLKPASLNGSLTSLCWLQKLGSSSGLPQPLASASQPVVHHIYRTQREAANRKKQAAKKAAAIAAAEAAPTAPPAAIAAAAAGGGSVSSGESTASSGDGSPSFSSMFADSSSGDEITSIADHMGVDWSKAPSAKPPHCYATLIYMAIMALKKDKVTVGEIYGYIRENFAYYRTHENGWKNSIRHTLIQQKCFVKVQQAKLSERPNEKGGYWTLGPDHARMFKNGVFKRKRLTVPQGTKGVRVAGNGGCGKPVPGCRPPKSKKKTKSKKSSSKRATADDGFVWPGIHHDMGGLLSAVSDLSDGDTDGVLEGINWDAMMPDEPPEHLNPATPSRHDDKTSMLSALTLMDESPAEDSPISIFPDINQNDGTAKPASPGYTLNELHDEVEAERVKSALGASLSISAQLNAVESTLDVSGGLAEFEKGGAPMAWNGEDLVVRGIGIPILADGIVPEIPSAECRTYIHITPDDLDDLESAPMPADWII